jgi:hypothetical protein
MLRHMRVITHLKRALLNALSHSCIRASAIIGLAVDVVNYKDVKLGIGHLLRSDNTTTKASSVVYVCDAILR